MMDTLSPTPEQLKKGYYEPPERNQQRNSPTFRFVGKIEELRKSNEIDAPQLEASKRYYTHMMGARGHNMSVGNGSKVSGEEWREYPQHDHSINLAAAQKALALPYLVWAVEKQLTEEIEWTVMGQYLRPGVKSRGVLRNVAVTTISTALDLLAYHWGFKNK